MMPPPDQLYDVPLWVDKAKVHPDHHIQIAHPLYSVPTRYLRQHVRVRADRQVVKIYFGTELIKMHKRQPPGGRSTDLADYPETKAVYALRDVDALCAKAKEKGVHIGLYAERLLGGTLPWTKMGQAYSLLSLCEKYGGLASRRRGDVPELARVPDRGCGKDRRNAEDSGESVELRSSGNVVHLPLPRFARPREHFETTTATSTKERG